MASRSAPNLRSAKTLGGDNPEDTSPSWVNGIKSVLDVTLEPPDYQKPFQPPAPLYLEEVSLGVVGGAGDSSPLAQAPHHAELSRKMGGKLSAADRMQALLNVLGGDPATRACRALFWLVLAGIFQVVPPEVIPHIRTDLGESWYACTLQVMSHVSGGADREAQDWIMGALPYVFAQAIYRLLVDGFVEDRKHFVKEADALLLKASMIAHFEVTGFQITPDTVRRCRRNLFLRRVLKCPHNDQREFMRGKKRQEILESHGANSSDQPLDFGRLTAQPFEETQLEHVMHGSDARRKVVERALSSGKAPWTLDTMPVPKELSVERYSNLSNTGVNLTEKHLARLAACMGMEAIAPPPPPARPACEERPHTHGQSPRNRSDSAVLSEPRTPDSAGMSPRGRSTPDEATGRAGRRGRNSVSPDHGDLHFEGEMTPQRIGRLWRKGMLVARLQLAGEDRRSRREREAKARKLKQELLLRMIVSEPLPEEVSERSLDTVWVSPTFMSLHRARTRNVLQKTSAEAFRLKMEVRPILTRPLSMPALKSAAQADGQQGVASRRRPGEASTVAGGSQSSPDKQGFREREESISGSVRGDTKGRGDAAVAGMAPTVPRSGVVSGALLPGGVLKGPGPASGKGEYITLEPPPRLSSRVIRQRLEAQEKAFQKQSFAIYMKEHDIFTGIKRLRYEDKRLRDEEDAYVKKMSMMLGGEPKKLIGPEAMLAKLRAGVAPAGAAGGGNGQGSEK